MSRNPDTTVRFSFAQASIYALLFGLFKLLFNDASFTEALLAGCTFGFSLAAADMLWDRHLAKKANRIKKQI
jgi:hypothetical protein